MNERILLGKLQIAGQDKGWVYEQAPLLCKITQPNKPTQAYDDFSRLVVTAVLEMQKNAEGNKVINAFKLLKFKVDVLPAVGGGFFMPNCEHEGAKAYEIPRGEDVVGAIIVWDPKSPFEHSKTSDGSSASYPPWVILAHEMGHAIQLGESAGGGSSWLSNYISATEKVEMDNIGRHETPIVTSLGLKPRIKYL